MSRLHLIVLFLFLSVGTLFGQSKISSYLKHAEEKYKNGDYYYALELYDKAMELDSNSVAILWNYAETLRAYKDYRKAEYYYKKVYDREEASIYPASLVYYGLMQKHNGNYEEAIETFKKAKKKYAKDKKGYLYNKSRRELESCLWAKSAVKDTAQVDFFRLPETVNTKDSEFGHALNNGKFIFSSLRADSISSNEEVYGTIYKTRLFQSETKGGRFEKSQRIEDLFYDQLSTGNGSFSMDGSRFYFSLCGDEGYNYKCKIMVARYENGKWTSPDSLGEIINAYGSNTTMPCIGELEGQEVLFFSSDREGTEGGMDIWYSIIKGGNQYAKARSVKTINSPDNELSPWWDYKSKRLYFSSSWHDGFGGYDVFYSDYGTQFEKPENLGIPTNSAANDLYYFKSQDTAYVTSNRLGVLYSKNPTCCSDIFSAVPPVKIDPPTPRETLAELNRRLPVTLYFHNDCPDPKNWDTITKVNYLTGYDEYRAMLEKYQAEYSSGLSKEKAEEAKEDIESFFIEYVDQGVKDLFLFRDLLLEELQKGAKIKVMVKGFASPLHKTDYNVNLTKRRISSFINYLMAYDNGVFAPYIKGNASNGGKVIFVGAPFGEYTANQLTSDNFHDQKNSVYSRAAAIERKVEIQSVSYLDDRKIFPLSVPVSVQDAGKVKAGTIIEKEFTIINNSKDLVELENPSSPYTFLEIETSTKTIEGGKSGVVKIRFNTDGFAGKNMKYVEVKPKGFDESIKLMITSEIE
jgi:tetratricopeptide (TPR) repeat protein